MLQNKIKISSIKNNFVAVIAFTLPLSKNLIPLLIVITLLLWVIEGQWKSKFQNMNKSYLLLAISLYTMHIIGMLYTNNIKAGGFELEQKLSLFVFPFLFLFNTEINDIQSNRILKSFLWGCVLSGIICFINAFIGFYISGQLDSFYYSEFSAILHASYFALYCCFACIILLFNRELNIHKYLKINLLAFLILLIVLTSSKSGVLSILLILIIKWLHETVVFKNYRKSLLMILILVFSALALYFVFPKSIDRFAQMRASLNHETQEINTTTSRIVIWKHAKNLIAKHLLFGVGTGDVKDQLLASYQQSHNDILLKKQLNAHNQYLQTGIGLGLVGISLLIGNLLFIFYLTIKTKIWDGAIFTLLIMFNMLFESMLETQAGVVFIAFFLMFYLSSSAIQIRKKNVTIAQ